jgi:hypothetical protein
VSTGLSRREHCCAWHRRLIAAWWRQPKPPGRRPTGEELACTASELITRQLELAARALLGNPHITIAGGISVHDTVGVAELVFALG